MSKTALVVLILLSLSAPPSLGLSGMRPTDAPLRLVIFAPWTDGPALVRRAGGALVGPRDAPMGALAYAEDRAAFDSRLRALGAWAVVDGTALARLCGVSGAPVSQGSPT